MSDIDVSLTLNGSSVSARVEPRMHLADFLREERLLTGTHIGCEQGVCGACTVLLDGRPVRSCITLASACDGGDVRTVEGYNGDPLMARIRDSFSRHHGLQCGFCTPGMLATAYDIVQRLPDADEVRIRRELSGNLCRCTGYAGIVAAIIDVLQSNPPTASLSPLPRTVRTRDIGAGVASGQSVGTIATPESDVRANAEAIDLDAVPDGVTLSRRLPIDAPIDDVWAVVRDIPTVVDCIPGASIDGPMTGNTFNGRCIVAVGPMKAQFRGNAAVRLDETARTGRVAGSGRDGLTRSSVDGILDFRLQGDGAAKCELHLDMTYRLNGPLAQFGRKALVEAIADRILADSADALTARATGGSKKPNAGQINGLSLVIATIRELLGRLFRG